MPDAFLDFNNKVRNILSLPLGQAIGTMGALSVVLYIIILPSMVFC